MGTMKGMFRAAGAVLLLTFAACQTPLPPHPPGTAPIQAPAPAPIAEPTLLPAPADDPVVILEEERATAPIAVLPPVAAEEAAGEEPCCEADSVEEATKEPELAPVDGDCRLECEAQPIAPAGVTECAPVPAVTGAPLPAASAPGSARTGSSREALLLMFAVAAAIGPLLVTGWRRA